MSETSNNFITQIVRDDLASKIHSEVITRFPPEPNGYLHIGHAKSICLNFGIADDFGGHCSLRFDDTNPAKESQHFANAIKEDVRWLGFNWGSHLHHASDYFETLYQYAHQLIDQGKAYVCDLSPEKIREYRGTLTEKGTDSPYRTRSVEENREIFTRMKDGEFADGERVLRAKIDMAAPNMNLRDPIIYRIRRIHHQRTGDNWCIYPTYDFTHGQSDALEGVTHSLCTLEFEDHRPLYDWFVENIPTPSTPKQYEFSRLSLEYTVMSKRWLTFLVDEKLVDGWDDPRMPTIAGLRRRGFTPASIREFCKRIGVTRSDNTIEMGVLEDAARQDLDKTSERRLGVLDPIKLVIENYDEDQEELFDVPNHPFEDKGTRKVPFSRELYIERDDFMEDAPRKYFRLSIGREVRLKYAYYVTCTRIDKDDNGNVTTIYCNYDPESRGGGTSDGRKVKGTIHWVSVRHAKEATINLYDRLFTVANPLAHKDDFASVINPDSLIVQQGFVEPSLAFDTPNTRYQLERMGYFVIDSEQGSKDAIADRVVLNRTVSLRDSWAKVKANK